MPRAPSVLSPPLRAALLEQRGKTTQAVHHLQLALARLLLDDAPPPIAGLLMVAEKYLAGDLATDDELMEARRDCWTYAGSLACGCSLADSVMVSATLSCLEAAASAHTVEALAELAESLLRSGVSEPRVLSVLRG